jgi:hypothetical protein
MKYPIETIAKWIGTLDGGATTRDLQEKFKLTPPEASRTLMAIRVMKRYDTIWVPGEGYPASKTCKPGRLYLFAINRPVFTKNPVGPVVGWCESTGDIVRFGSVYDADLQGGFCNQAIYQCLLGASKLHGGYEWFKKADWEARCAATQQS